MFHEPLPLTWFIEDMKATAVEHELEGAVGWRRGEKVFYGEAAAQSAFLVGLSTLLSAVTHAPFMAAFMAAEPTGQYHLFPWLLPLNFLAWLVAKRFSDHSLYAIATPAPLSS